MNKLYKKESVFSSFSFFLSVANYCNDCCKEDSSGKSDYKPMIAFCFVMNNDNFSITVMNIRCIIGVNNMINLMMGVIMIYNNMVSRFISMMNINVLNSIIMFVNDNSLLIMCVINVVNNGLWSSLVMYYNVFGWVCVMNDNVFGWSGVMNDGCFWSGVVNNNVLGWSSVMHNSSFWSGMVNDDILSWSSVVNDSSLWLSSSDV